MLTNSVYHQIDVRQLFGAILFHWKIKVRNFFPLLFLFFYTFWFSEQAAFPEQNLIRFDILQDLLVVCIETFLYWANN